MAVIINHILSAEAHDSGHSCYKVYTRNTYTAVRVHGIYICKVMTEKFDCTQEL